MPRAGGWHAHPGMEPIPALCGSCLGRVRRAAKPRLPGPPDRPFVDGNRRSGCRAIMDVFPQAAGGVPEPILSLSRSLGSFTVAEVRLQADTRITLERIEGYIEGFWWILPNLGIALVVSALFLIAAGLARRAVLRAFKRRTRSDLATMLAGAARWGIIG